MFKCFGDLLENGLLKRSSCEDMEVLVLHFQQEAHPGISGVRQRKLVEKRTRARKRSGHKLPLDMHCNP